MTNKLSAKFLEIFRNLKSDAVARPPRPHSFNENAEDTQDENVDNSNNNAAEDIFSEKSKSKKGKKKPKYKKSSSTPEPDPMPTEDEADRRDSNGSSVVNTQASGNVINIVNASNIRWGNEFVYYLGPVNGHQSSPKTPTHEEVVEKTNLIKLLMDSDVQPSHEYIDYVSKNLGKNWYSIFRSLGYTRGQIETAEIDNAKNGVAEARYKLLLDWVRNDDNGTLGKLATVLWEEDERHIVKELAVIYQRDKK
uniref:IMD-like protein n=1 Tax=Appias lyncida TaxID=441318 RepID=I3V9Q0_9NEOP|nr:IMD-like protein [Appias lyncida]